MTRIWVNSSFSRWSTKMFFRICKICNMKKNWAKNDLSSVFSQKLFLIKWRLNLIFFKNLNIIRWNLTSIRIDEFIKMISQDVFLEFSKKLQNLSYTCSQNPEAILKILKPFKKHHLKISDDQPDRFFVIVNFDDCDETLYGNRCCAFNKYPKIL